MPFSATTNQLCGSGLGAVNSPCAGSLRGLGTWVATTDVVPMISPQRVGRRAPVPTAEVTESIVAPATSAAVVSPRCSAAAAVSRPRGAPSGTSGGSRSGSTPAIPTSSSSYSVTPHVALSITPSGNIVPWVAVTWPVSRAASASIGSTNAAAASWTSGHSLRMKATCAGRPPGDGGAPCTSAHRRARPGEARNGLCAPARASIHITALASGRPSAATATVLVYWLVTATNPISAPRTTARSSAWRTLRPSACHQPSGSCSAAPSAPNSSGSTSPAWPSTRPCGSTTATFNPVVPRSTATTCPGPLVVMHES